MALDATSEDRCYNDVHYIFFVVSYSGSLLLVIFYSFYSFAAAFSSGFGRSWDALCYFLYDIHVVDLNQ